MNISKTFKTLVALNEFTEEYNKHVYKNLPVLDATMNIYSKSLASEAMVKGSTIEKLIGLGLTATSHKKLPLLNTACMVTNRILLIKRVGLKKAIIIDLTNTVTSTVAGYALVKFKGN